MIFQLKISLMASKEEGSYIHSQENQETLFICKTDISKNLYISASAKKNVLRELTSGNYDQEWNNLRMRPVWLNWKWKSQTQEWLDNWEMDIYMSL